MICKNKDYHLSERLIRIGGEFEWLNETEPRDFKRLIALEKEMDRIGEENPTLWIAPIIVRGRNVIRRVKRMELLHV